jgi:hypothetical protein
MADDVDVRERLAHVREILTAQVLFDGDAASWAAEAIERFLAGEVSTLDVAFGLGAAAHRPADTERRFELALKARELRNAGKSWREVADEFSSSGASITSERAITRLVDEFTVRLTAHALTKRLEASDPD